MALFFLQEDRKKVWELLNSYNCLVSFELQLLQEDTKQERKQEEEDNMKRMELQVA